MPEIATTLLPKPTLPDCVGIPQQAEKLSLRLPFGLRLDSIRQSLTSFQPTDELLMSFMGQIQPALTPIKMVLTLAKIAKAMADCVEAVKDAVSSLSPGPIIECIENLVTILPKLLEFVPPLSYIPTLVDLVLTIISILDAFIGAVDAAIAASLRVADFSGAVEANPILQAYEACVEREAEATSEGIAFAVEAFSPLFGILAEFLDIVGIGPVKKYVEPMQQTAEAFASLDASDVGAPLQERLRDTQAILREIGSVLRPFGG